MKLIGEQRTTVWRHKSVRIGGAVVGVVAASVVGLASPAAAFHLPTDVSLEKSCAPATVVPGKNVTCTLTVFNAGPVVAGNLVVTDSLDPGLTVVSAGGDDFTCEFNDDSVECTRPGLGVGVERVITVVARVNDDVGPETVLGDFATVDAENPDPDPLNNLAFGSVSTPTCTINASGGDTIEGTAGKDVICGSAGGDIINGGGGNDVIFGLGGADIINGGNGNDTIFGGAGDDILNGNAGADTIFGGAGDDILTGGGGNDKLFGQGGQDIASGNGGTDTCTAEDKDTCEL